ncbi:Protein phosphatase 1 regulatory subunit 3G [Dissostichus eleginoides]|uniref:Protein phosphatase 1 regulatory subunit 3G n=1 Tax=Dissostichus eleginoides TaxID=100907 RepID=A0AAD9F4F0_DISEL|nr:Protein phosphatase 1 regulatory subunit 3G [Dissostichus eleginoides]
MTHRRRARSLPVLLLDSSGRTAPKRVKFADSMGLNLASVKTFCALEDPRIPKKVLSRHKSFPPPQQDFLTDLCASFKLGLDLESRAQRLCVTLESVTVSRFDFRGHIRVFSGCKHREVGVRYTFNDWLSHVDAQAVPVLVPAEQEDQLMGRFEFTVFTPPFMEPGSSVHFAVFLRGEEGEFWDNNEGKNYSLKLQSNTPCVSAEFNAS